MLRLRLKLLCVTLLGLSFVHAQSNSPTSTPPSSNAPPPAITEMPSKPDVSNDDLFPPRHFSERVSLARGVLKQLDPIRDQMVLHTFGGGDLRIAFDVQTKLFPESAGTHLTSIRPGTVISVDTVMSDGKLFARSVRLGTNTSSELNGQVVRYDATRSQLVVRDPISPENVTLRLSPGTTVVRQGKPASVQALTAGMLVRVWFAQNAAKRIEILAERGNTFTFQGRIIAVDLHSRVLSLLNDTDQSLRELSFSSLDNSSLGLLREGAGVAVTAEFDGERYNIRKVTPVQSSQQ